MALRHRDIVSSIADRENHNAKPPKALLSKHLSRRPALDELSNRINNVTKANTKKPEIKPPVKETKHKKEEEPIKAYSTIQLDTVAEHEAETNKDPQMVSEYLTDIFQYLRELETKYPIKEKYLEGHSSSPRMRAILVNWLVQVHMNFSLCLETLHLCVSITDRYLQGNPKVGRESLQLVGTAALLIACKYEEMYLPELSDFVYICDNSFSKEQILKMEMRILIDLDCSLGKPLSIHFLRRFSKLANVRLEQHNLAKYLLELALVDYEMCHVKPSLHAAAACCLSISILNNNAITCPSKMWTPNLALHTTYKYSDLKPILIKLASLIVEADLSKNKSVHLKYSESKYNKISLHPKLKGSLVKKLAELAPKA